MTIDLLEDVAPSSGDLGAVAKVGLQMQELEKEVEQLDTQLRLKKQTLRTLAESTLPDLMQELNIRNFTLNNGAKVSVSEVISAALPTATAIERARGEEQLQLAERKYDGLEWLRDNGGSDIIKNNVRIQFGSKEDAECTKFTKDLDDKKIFYKKFTDVHAGTLKAFIKERLSEGKQVPHETFKIYTGRVAKIEKGDK